MFAKHNYLREKQTPGRRGLSRCVVRVPVSVLRVACPKFVFWETSMKPLKVSAVAHGVVNFID